MIHTQQPFVPTVTISIQDYEMMHQYQTAILEKRIIVYSDGKSYLADETELIASQRKEIQHLEHKLAQIRRDIEVHGLYRIESVFSDDKVYKCTKIRKPFWK